MKKYAGGKISSFMCDCGGTLTMVDGWWRCDHCGFTKEYGELPYENKNKNKGEKV